MTLADFLRACRGLLWPTGSSSEFEEGAKIGGSRESWRHRLWNALTADDMINS